MRPRWLAELSARAAGLRPGRPRARSVLMAVPADDLLFQSVAAVRRLGARVTRYDAEEGTLEARVASGRRSAVLRLRVVPAGERRARLTIESDAPGWRLLVWRLRAELASAARE